jgi:peptidoglycan hydrolase-like protein with peptidoglycan-binding domain
MNGIHSNIQRLVVSLTAAACMTALPAIASHATSHMAYHKHTRIHVRHHKGSQTVRSAQLELRSSGFYHGKIDGVSGRKTQAAIRAYQRRNHLPVTGRLDMATLRHLGVQRAQMGEAARARTSASSAMPSAPMPSRSTSPMAMPPAASRAMAPSASTIEEAQRQLKAKGLYSGDPTGVWDSQTQSAVRQYQQNNNLNVTGQLDDDTLKSLGITATNPSNPANPSMPPNE